MPLHSGYCKFVTTQTSSSTRTTRIVIKSTNKRYCPAWTSFNKLNSICNHPHKMVPCTHYTRRRRRRGRQGQGRGRFAIPDHASVSPPSKAQAAGSGRTGENMNAVAVGLIGSSLVHCVWPPASCLTFTHYSWSPGLLLCVCVCRFILDTIARNKSNANQFDKNRPI